MKQITFDDLVKNIIEGKEVYVYENAIGELAIKYIDPDTGEQHIITKDDPIDQEDIYIIDPTIKYELDIIEYLGPLREPYEGKKTKTFIHEHDTIKGAMQWANDIITAELGCEALFQFNDVTVIKDKKYKIYSVHACVYLDDETKMIGEPIGVLKEIPANQIVGN